MIENHTDRLVNDFETGLIYQGIDLQKYLELVGIDMESFRKQFRSRAEKEVKVQLVLEKIKNLEGISVSDEDVDEEIKRVAKAYNQDEQVLRDELEDEQREYLVESVGLKKTIDFLVENAKLV